MAMSNRALGAHCGSTAPTGALSIAVYRKPKFRTDTIRGLIAAIGYYLPWKTTDPVVRSWRWSNLFRHILPALPRLVAAKVLNLPHFTGLLYLRVKRANGLIEDYGLASMRVVTTAGVGFIVDAFQNLVELENMKFHALGTGTNAEAVGDTALQTELTTQYNPDNTRATGTTAEAAANIYQTAGTNTVDAAAAVTEHGILTQAATGGGVLLDRSVFSVINLASGDSVLSTYELTVNSGG